MELYVLDSQLRRSVVVDSFVSCLWTERYNDVGDMTLNIHSTLANRNLLTTGTYLAMNRSTRVMEIETVEDRVNQDGSQILVVTGSSLELLLDDRVARDVVSITNGTSAEPKWIITGLPAAIARQIFQNILVDCVLDAGDVLPFYTVGNMYPTDTIAEPTDSVEADLDIMSVLDALKTICQTYDLGFRITRNADTSQLFFNVYSGNDRTSGQTVFPAVVFSPQLDNLLDSSYLTSIKQYKNVAYVFCPDGTAKVYDQDVDPSVSGFQRHVVWINATDITYPDRATYGAGGTPVYTVTASQIAAVKVAQGLLPTTDFQKASLGKITSLERILPQDLVNINTAIAPTFALVGSQLTSLTFAYSAAGVTQDQKNALLNLATLIRLSAADVSALNTMLANNTAIAGTPAIDVAAAANLQNSTMMPSEQTIINAAVTTSQGYNATEDAILNTLLQARGTQELQNYNNITAFDGEIPQTGSYKYDIDYFLGDIAEVHNQDGVVNDVRVTEQIFSQDATGEKVYPTLSSRLVITPGVWAAWDANQQWNDVVDTEHWGDLT